MSQLGLAMTPEDEVRAEERRRRRQRGRRVRSLIALALSLAVLLVAGVAVYRGGAQLLGHLKASSAPDYSGSGTGQASVRVPEGASVSKIGNVLKKAGVVKSVDAFLAAATGNSKATAIQPGFYRLRRHMSAESAVTLMVDPSSRVVSRVTVPEGQRVTDTIATIAKSTDISAAALQAALRKPAKLGLPSYARGRIEGFLFPATYDVDPGTTATSLLRAMVQRYDQAAARWDLTHRAADVGLTPYQVLTMASIAEQEARHPADFPKVTRVLYNRLHKGMYLQLDSTINYALKTKKVDVLYTDLKVKSPYNTYKHAGLPPTPIDSPGETALKAALQPASGDWLYFVTVDPETGETKFTSSYSQFQEFRREFNANK